MQKTVLRLASGIHNITLRVEAELLPLSQREGKSMSKTASAALRAPSAGLFSRLFATIDRLLLAYAQMTIRNGDIPRHGV